MEKKKRKSRILTTSLWLNFRGQTEGKQGNKLEDY